MSRIPLIDKILLLESKIGKETAYSILDPFEFDSNNPVEVQKAGRKIAEHLGMWDCTFVITYVPQKESTAGHIHIDQSREVFVEIDPNYRDNHAVVLYILAHELCHKFLYRKGIVLSLVLENEILTDITTVFTGLGKLALTGCESMEGPARAIPGAQGTLRKLGYINRYQLAFVFTVWCTMQKVKPHVLYNHFPGEVIRTIREVKTSEYEHFSELYFDPFFIPHQWQKNLKSSVEETQKILATIDRYQRLLNLRDEITLLSDLHRCIKSSTALLKPEQPTRNLRAPHVYIENLRGYLEMKMLEDVLSKNKKALQQHKNKRVAEVQQSAVAQSRLKINPDILKQFSCPECNCAMRISEFKLVKVSCTTCHYGFLVDARIEVSPKTPAIEKLISFLKPNWFWKGMNRK
ncbi:MAG: hypothetical protein ACKVOK_16655 [Flavobacteriales bacterium]